MQNANAERLPPVDLRQFLTLTDGTGMLQHSMFATPNPQHGYCTDDNARALIAGVMYEHLRPRLEGEGVAVLPGRGGGGCGDLLVPLQRHLAFLLYAFNPETGRFRNFMGFDRRWLEEAGSEDSHARAIWGLGATFALAPNDSVRGTADKLLHDALPTMEAFRHMKPWAHALVGLDEYLAAASGDEQASRLRVTLAERLHELWRVRSADDWPWWDDILTWGNAKLPHALLVSGAGLGREEMIEAGLKVLDWLLELQTAEGAHLSIIGNKGWCVRNGARARFDQQPLEAHGMVHACLAAARITGERRWEEAAERAFGWFLGRNDIGVPLYDDETGGCHDGLTPDGVNPNEGAESTLAYLLSVLELYRFRRERG